MGHTLPALLGQTFGVIAWAAEVLAWASGEIGRTRVVVEWISAVVGRANGKGRWTAGRDASARWQASRASGMA